MNRLILLFILMPCISFSQPLLYCIGDVPQSATVVCDSVKYFTQDNKVYWAVNADSADVGVIGSGNTVYFNNGNFRHFSTQSGNNNRAYIKGGKIHVGIHSNKNIIYMANPGTAIISGDSNIVYGSKVAVYFYGNNNVVYTDTFITLGNQGQNNTHFNYNTCPEIGFTTGNAPLIPCLQVTGITEDVISIDIYPNPAADNVTFNLQNAGEIKTITIYDIAGKTIEVIANINADKATIDTSKLSTGMYVYSITLANGKTKRGKLLVG